MAYTKTGPFTDGSAAPGISAAFLNNVETALVNALPTTATAFGPADLNTYFTTSGTFRGSGLTNAPGGSAGSFMVVVFYASSTLQVQQAFGLGDNSMWFRTMNSGTWASWLKVTAA